MENVNPNIGRVQHVPKSSSDRLLTKFAEVGSLPKPKVSVKKMELIIRLKKNIMSTASAPADQRNSLLPPRKPVTFFRRFRAVGKCKMRLRELKTKSIVAALEKQTISASPNLEAEHTWQEAFKVLGISWNSNGTLNREIQIPMVPATPSADSSNPPPIALSTDITLSYKSDAYVRLYIPLNPPKNKKLPIVIYLHGGDFVLFSLSTVIFHNFCNDIASQFPAVVVSVEYRLAPENRLPAAYDDALNALFWVQDQAKGTTGRDPWMEYGDFSRVFILGSSAGANIAYHVALRALDFNLKPLKIKGLLLNQAFFSGMQKTESEARLEDDPYVALYVNYVLWSLALPKNVNRDHEFCNPISGGTYLGRVFRLPKVYIKGDYGDPLVDRSVQLAQFLISCRVPVTYRFNPGGFHGIELNNKTAAQELYDDMKKFVNSISEIEPENYYASS